MSDQHPDPTSDETSGTSADDRRRHDDRRSLIDLTRAERGEPERRRLPGVDRRSGEGSGGEGSEDSRD